jgi:carboxyl-terminal processing protease
MLKFFKNILTLLLLIAIIGISFFIGKEFGFSECRVCPPEDINFSLFWEGYQELKNNFIDEGEITEEKIIYGALSGVADSLDDPYTIFLDPDETKIFLEDTEGVFEGVGMEIGLRDNQLTVIAPLKETPAQKAGIRSGDKIIKINETFTNNMIVEEAVKLIRGEKGTEVSLMIMREGWKEAKEFKVERGVIEIPSMEWELMSSSENKKDIAYLKIYHFSSQAKSDFRTASSEVLKSSAEKIILDLRNNPGGYLYVAKDIAGWFLNENKVVVIEDFNGKEEEKIYESEGPSTLMSYPVIILINGGTASGSEILAGALRDNKGVKLVGEKSFGKGCVQQIKKLSDGSTLKITVANWLTPNRTSISEKGLEPDIEIEMTEEDYLNNKDPQLEKAIEVIKEIR